MDRFFADAGAWDDARVLLGSRESHHCLRVMRKRLGDKVEVFDGKGRWGIGVITELSDTEAAIRLEQEERERRRLPAISLAVALSKGKVMDSVVQKAVELGVDRIQPMLTEHTVVRLEQESLSGRQKKWRRIALEACKQCGQNFVPEVRSAVSFEEVVRENDDRAGLLASLHQGALPLKDALRKIPVELEGIGLLIGPEGDFSVSERELAVDGGFHPVSLGPLVLRVETAVTFGLSVLVHELR